MADHAPASAVLNIDADDLVLPFAVEGLDVRGRVARLGPAVDAILARHDYPEPVAALLAEAMALTVLLGSSLKIDGRFILQTQTDGPVSLIVVDFDVPEVPRLCLFDDDAARSGPSPRTPAEALLGKGISR